MSIILRVILLFPAFLLLLLVALIAYTFDILHCIFDAAFENTKPIFNKLNDFCEDTLEMAKRRKKKKEDYPGMNLKEKYENLQKKVETLYSEIEHGDKEHREWLKWKLEEHFRKGN